MLKEEVLTYIENLIPDPQDYVKQIEVFAKENNVPIMEKTGIEVLLLLLSMQQPKKIVEIGTAIGYSAIRIHVQWDFPFPMC